MFVNNWGGEANIETLPLNIFVFVYEVLHKNYTNISDTLRYISAADTFCAQISP